MAELMLNQGESLIISSHVQVYESGTSSHPKTGDAFLTDKRFAFIGREQIKTLGNLVDVVKGRGEKYFEIPTSALIEVNKGGMKESIEVVYGDVGGERKILIKPERVRYVGALLNMGVTAASEKVGEMVTDYLSEEAGELGEKVGGYISGEIREFAQGTMEEVLTGLVGTWMDAFHHSMEQSQALESEIAIISEPQDLPVLRECNHAEVEAAELGVTAGEPQDLPVLKRSYRIEAIPLEQIFEEELGSGFRDFEIPLGQVDYLSQLGNNVEKAENETEREKWSQELRVYLRQLKDK